jgi:hypothetical protein
VYATSITLASLADIIFSDDPPSPKFTCALTPLGVAEKVGIGIVSSFAVVRAQLPTVTTCTQEHDAMERDLAQRL